MSTEYQTPPRSVEELLERLDEVTQEMFLAAWLEEPERTSAMEESAAALDAWSLLGRIGIEQPAWVSVAFAAMSYGRNGIG